jgi:hypothetical protein
MVGNYGNPLSGLRMQPTLGPGPAGGVVLPPTPGTAMAGPGGMSPPPSVAYHRQQQGVYPQGPMAPPLPPGMYPPNPMQAAPPGAYSPYQGRPTAQGGNPMGQGVMTAGYNAPPVPGMNPGAVAANRPLAGPEGLVAQSVPAMLNTMQESLYPSQREWAADHLAACDWRTYPHVITALVNAATKDPAATVRTGCVRALAKMGVNTVPVINAMQSLKTDVDPRVRQAVDDALATLAPAGADK